MTQPRLTWLRSRGSVRLESGSSLSRRMQSRRSSPAWEEALDVRGVACGGSSRDGARDAPPSRLARSTSWNCPRLRDFAFVLRARNAADHDPAFRILAPGPSHLEVLPQICLAHNKVVQRQQVKHVLECTHPSFKPLILDSRIPCYGLTTQNRMSMMVRQGKDLTFPFSCWPSPPTSYPHVYSIVILQHSHRRRPPTDISTLQRKDHVLPSSGMPYTMLVSHEGVSAKMAGQVIQEFASPLLYLSPMNGPNHPKENN